MITAGVAVLALLNRSLVSGATDTASAKARNVAAALAAGGPVAEPALTATPGETAAVQILDAVGRVVRSSAELAGEPPILTGLPPAGGDAVATVALPLGQNNAEYRVVAVSSAGYTVVAAQSLEGARTAVARLAVLLVAAAVPLLALAWLAVHLALGAALGPVEAMRRTVAEVSMTDLAVRVPVPRAQDEIQRLASTLNAMLARLASAQAAQRRFVADASHELRSPLSTITATLDLAARHPGRITMAELVDINGAEAARLGELVDDLLVLARTDDGSDAPPAADVDLDDVVRAEAIRLNSIGGLTIEARVRPARIRGNAAQVARAVRNLTENAREHAESTVRLVCRREGRLAVVEVSDDGAGVPAAERSHVFGRFVRLDAERDRGHGGAGLGLAIVAGIAARHGGRAQCLAPPPGRHGAFFRVEFPAAEEDPGAAAARVADETPD